MDAIVNKPVLRSISALVVLSKTYQQGGLLQVEPQRFTLSEYQEDVTPAVMAKLVNYPLVEAKPRWMVGKVYSFDVLPSQRHDPVLVYCPAMDLRAYYFAWSVMVMADSWRVSEHLELYDASIQTAIRSARTLSDEELHFAIYEMLHFRNAILGGKGGRRSTWDS